MWFLTIDPFVGIPVFIAKLSKRQDCWRVFEDFQSRIYPTLWHTVASSCVCTSPLAVMTIVGLHDFVKVSISALLKSLFCWSCALTLRSRQQILVPQVSTLMQAGTYFPETRRMLLFGAPLIFKHIFGQLPRCFSGTLLLPLCLFLWTILKFWSIGATLTRFTWDKCNRARDFGLEF